MSNNGPEQDETFQKLVRETGKIEWKALAPHYESGGLVLVDNPLDLVKVAYSFAKDERDKVAAWMDEGRVARVSEEQMQQWNGTDPLFWAVVVAPWVLIQPVITRQ
ncbi:DUF2288 domain-containing protein [Gilvimarinus sp. F26214L]|uniref:DUF2288 domain-containing protein n=1 Tax=Gilvimarinus sp. DZF01 TaxID=3461371 RepID=UPI0040466F04